MRLHRFDASELSAEDHALAASLDRRRLLIPPGCYLLELLFARRPEKPHRRFSYFVYAWEPSTNRHHRFGVSSDDHDTDWAVRQAAKRELVRISVTGKAGAANIAIEVFPPPFTEDELPRLLAREWVQPLEGKGPLRVPFVIDPGEQPSARMLVVGLKPSVVFDEADLREGYTGVRSIETFVDSLYHRSRFQALVDAATSGKLIHNDLDSFQLFMSGRTGDLSVPTNEEDFIRESTDLAPYSVVYSWLSSTPSQHGEQAFLRQRYPIVPGELKPASELVDDDARLAEIFLRIRPAILIVHGNIPIRRIRRILGRLTERYPLNILPRLPSGIPAAEEVDFAVMERVFTIGHHSCVVIPVCDLKHFNRDAAGVRTLPPEYWHRFKAHLRRSLTALVRPPNKELLNLQQF